MHLKNNRVKYIKFFLFLAVSLVSGLVNAESDRSMKKQTLLTAGWLERVILEPWNIKMRAKLDSGAKTSSLHAIDFEYFKRDGYKWVRFLTFSDNEKNPLVSIEVPLVRTVKIKRHNLKSKIRPVVFMTFCLDGEIYNGEFSLNDRSKFHYPILLGRRLLQQGILVDPASTFTLKTKRKKCKKMYKAFRAQESKNLQATGYENFS
jgi:hypothetical protein